MSLGSKTARCGDSGAFDIGFVRTDCQSNRVFRGPERVGHTQHVLAIIKSRRLGPIKSKNARCGDAGAFDVGFVRRDRDLLSLEGLVSFRVSAGAFDVGFVRTDQIERSKDASGPSSDHPRESLLY